MLSLWRVAAKNNIGQGLLGILSASLVSWSVVVSCRCIQDTKCIPSGITFFFFLRNIPSLLGGVVVSCRCIQDTKCIPSGITFFSFFLRNIQWDSLNVLTLKSACKIAKGRNIIILLVRIVLSYVESLYF